MQHGCNIAVQMCSKPAIKGTLRIHKIEREVSWSGDISLNLFTISTDVLLFLYLPHSKIRKLPKVWRNEEIEFCKLSKNSWYLQIVALNFIYLAGNDVCILYYSCFRDIFKIVEIEVFREFMISSDKSKFRQISSFKLMQISSKNVLKFDAKFLS